jgi:hypothetical protein
MRSIMNQSLPMPSDQARSTRAFILGISGGTWDVVGPLVAAGRMPNLGRLIENGASGTLLSVRAEGDKHYRPQIAWMSVATGCLPAHHGVTAFYHTSADVRRPCLWDIFQASGRSVGLFYWPLTWPPKPTNGFVIPCYHARDDATWPPELAAVARLDRQRHAAGHGREAASRPRIAELAVAAAALWRHGGVRAASAPFLLRSLGQSLVTHDAERRALLLRHAKTEVHADLFLRLIRRDRPHLATFHTFLADHVSHRYWQYREPEKFGIARSRRQARLATAVDDAYIRIDHVLGRILRALPHDTVAAVVSEHGMAAELESAEVGDWQFVIRGGPLAALVGLSEDVVPCPIARWIAYRPRHERSLPAGTAARFGTVKVVETGLPLFNVHEHGSDEAIVKFSIDRAVPRYAAGNLASLTVEYEGRRLAFTEIARRAGPRRSAMHAQRGMWVMAGPGIGKGVRLPDANVIDFAPTLLAAVGLPPLSGCDGRVVEQVFG